MNLPHGPEMDLREVLREHLAVQCPNRSSDWHSFAFANPERQTCFQPSIRASDDRQTTDDKIGDLNPTQWPNARCAGLASSKAKFRTKQDLNQELDKIFKARNFIDSQKSLKSSKASKAGSWYKKCTKIFPLQILLRCLQSFCANFFRYARSSSRTFRKAPSRFSSEPSTAAGSLKL